MPFFKFGEIAKNDYVCIIFEIWLLMAEYRSKYRGQEVDALLDKIAEYANPETPEIEGGNKWELIETITLEEEVSAIEKSTEPNGDAYAFRDIAVIISNVEQSTWKSAIVFKVDFNKNMISGNGAYILNTMRVFRDNCTFDSKGVAMMARLVNINNVLQIGINQPTVNPGYINGYPDGLSSYIFINNTGALISSFQINSATLPFLPNTKFKIYAIR